MSQGGKKLTAKEAEQQRLIESLRHRIVLLENRTSAHQNTVEEMRNHMERAQTLNTHFTHRLNRIENRVMRHPPLDPQALAMQFNNQREINIQLVERVNRLDAVNRSLRNSLYRTLLAGELANRRLSELERWGSTS